MLAYLILEHKSPRQLSRLIEALQHPKAAFFVHLDAKAEPGQFRYMTRAHDNVHFLDKRLRQFITWGGWNMVQAELHLTRAALDAGAESLLLLSGTDYPVWSNRKLVEFFLSAERSHIEHFPLPCPFWDLGGLNRIRQYWLSDDPIRIKQRLYRRTLGRLWQPFWHLVIRRFANLGFKLGYELGLRRSYPKDLAPYAGSQWWALTRAGAEAVMELCRARPRVVRFYRHSHIPDEGFFQTALLNSPQREAVVNDNLRYLEWDSGFSPRFLEHGDLDVILRSGAAFVRKVTLGTVKDPKSGVTVNSAALVAALDELRKDTRDERRPQQGEPPRHAGARHESSPEFQDT